jgi:hypothetical protein
LLRRSRTPGTFCQHSCSAHIARSIHPLPPLPGPFSPTCLVNSTHTAAALPGPFHQRRGCLVHSTITAPGTPGRRNGPRESPGRSRSRLFRPAPSCRDGDAQQHHLGSLFRPLNLNPRLHGIKSCAKLKGATFVFVGTFGQEPPPMAQVPSVTRDTLSEVSGIVANSIAGSRLGTTSVQRLRSPALADTSAGSRRGDHEAVLRQRGGPFDARPHAAPIRRIIDGEKSGISGLCPAAKATPIPACSAQDRRDAGASARARSRA